MGIGYWDPMAGITAENAFRAEMDASVRAYRAQLRDSKAPHSRSRKAKKCEGCGSHTFALTRGGRVCSYCRTPEGDDA